jgi:hypothetical protein
VLPRPSSAATASLLKHTHTTRTRKRPELQMPQADVEAERCTEQVAVLLDFLG